MGTQAQRAGSAASTAPRPPSSSGRSPRSDDVTPDEQPEPGQQAEQREALEFWGYLFKQDKTGTDKLKSLLRGLKDVVNTEYDPSDSPDLTPAQLAHFYRDLHGNYDQLFLGTPHESIAFIYKSLGCMHSLQPQAYHHSKAFTDPTVPALKTEGWIMWQTIQLLLGPDEHAGFLREAVQKWDVKDPDTGMIFPKILPRASFPSDPDKHMVAWYEGVSERLRREAEEEEERTQDNEASRAATRRLHARQEDTDDEGSVDSKGPALAYFRNPLYRHVDGRPSIVTRNSKRPSASPRPSSMKGKGKEAVGTFGHIVRNVASPNLWNGKGGGSGSDSRERDKDRDRRRRSLPEHNRRRHSNGPSPQNDDGSGPAMTRQRRHPSMSTSERPNTASSASGGRYQDDRNPTYSPHLSPRPTSQHRGSRDSHDPSLRHSRSHDPTPSQKESGDYFAGYEHHQQQQQSPPEQRRNSANDDASPPASSGAPSANENQGPSAFAPGGFGPSASPLFASHVARQPQPRISASDIRSGNVALPSRRPPSIRFSQDKDDSSPRPGNGDRRGDPRRHDSPRRPRFEQSPAGYEDDDSPHPPPSGRRAHRGSHDQPPSRRRSGRRSGSDFDYDRPPPPPSDHGRNRSRDDSRRRDEGRKPSKPKQTRFAGDQPPSAPATKGVHGRKYVDDSPWR
nr:hypothetical protein CFP56_66819 [Quercus suber]